VTDWQTIWLAVIAVAVLVMAVVQVGLVVVVMRSARQATDTLQQVRRDVQPILERAQRISDEAARATALATAQVERIDGVLASTAVRIDQTLSIVQGAIVEPVRQGAAVVAAVRAAMAVFRGIGERQRSARSEEEALFVG
jgi:uncharacterized protein YoxC